MLFILSRRHCTVYPKKYAHGFCFAVLCCGYTLTDFPISIRLTSLALWQSNDCPSASKATLMNMDKHFMWIHYERLHNHNKAKHNKTVCIFLGIYCMAVLLLLFQSLPFLCPLRRRLAAGCRWRLLHRCYGDHGCGGKWVNSLRVRHNGSHFADSIFKCIIVNEKVKICS